MGGLFYFPPLSSLMSGSGFVACGKLLIKIASSIKKSKRMSIIPVIKWFSLAALSCVVICVLSCNKPEGARQYLYIPVSGGVYDTSLNKGMAGAWIFIGRRPSYSGIGNGPAFTIYDSLRTDSAGHYSYMVKEEGSQNYSVGCGVPPGYTDSAFNNFYQLFYGRVNDKIAPLKIDFVLVR